MHVSRDFAGVTSQKQRCTLRKTFSLVDDRRIIPTSRQPVRHSCRCSTGGGLMLRRLILATVAIGLLSMNVATTFASGRSGPLTLTGRDAAAYKVPNDVAKLWSARLPIGLTQVRYQQVVGGAEVLGGQLTFLRDANGVNKAVIGAHYPGLAATNARNITANRAQGIAAARIGN